MTSRLFNIVIIFLFCYAFVNGQEIKEKEMKLFDGDKKLVEARTETFNVKGKIVKSVSRNNRFEESVTISKYYYNENGQLIKESFAALRAYRDSTNTKRWTDTNTINTSYYTYNAAGQLKFKKTYASSCNFDTCDVIEYFYNGKLLKRKFCSNHCSMKTDNYNYPVYYEYNKNDSLVLEKAFGP